MGLAAVRKAYYCKHCDARFSKEESKCPSCGKWNTIKEGVPDLMSTNVVRLGDVDPEVSFRISTGMPELDEVLGGGVVPGQVILIGGEPGAGKSTLLLEVADAMSRRGALNLETGKSSRKKKNSCLYVTCEETIEKIAARKMRIGRGENVLICHNRKLEDIEADFAEHMPEFGIIDSLSLLDGCDTLAGQVAAIKRIYAFADATKTTIFVVVHINKDGDLAGAKAVEHAVDTVLRLDQDQKNSAIRQLRATKNRYGSEDYVGLFEMTEKGLYPFDMSKLVDGSVMAPGQAYAVAAMGNKSVLCEVQALVVPALNENKESLSVIGYDTKRVRTLLAVLTKHTSVSIDGKDIYVSIVGGVDFSDAALDAAVAAAIASATQNKKLPKKTAFAGETDLLGQIKLLGRNAQRKDTAEKHGFELMTRESLSALFEAAGIDE